MATSRIFLAALLQGAAHGAEFCSNPTGGKVPLAFEGCPRSTGKCYDWIGGSCEGASGWCVCDPSKCVMDGQCVDKGSCPTLTGGTCAVERCDRWRNASCSTTKRGEGRGAQCLCGPGTCPIEGECRAPGDCAKSTGGSCRILGCQAWRKSTCSVTGVPGPTEEARCMCDANSCPINGECVPKGSCPRYAGSSCKVFQATGLLPCEAGECSDKGYCECQPGECFVKGKCVPADAATIQLSLQLGREGLTTTAGLYQVEMVVTAGAASLLAALLAYKASRSLRAGESPSEYQSLEG